MTFAGALRWSFLADLTTKAVGPVVFVVLVRLLTPEDFGVMAAAMMVVAFSQIFWEAGMGKALIQRQTEVVEAAHVAFWINIALGILIASILFLAAETIQHNFFQDQRVTLVLKVMTLQVLLGAASSVQTALLQKEMGFKRLFWVRFATVGIPGMASIPLALSGLGYWALVAGSLVGQFAQLIMLWYLSPWRPALKFKTSVAREMCRFGAWVASTGLLAWFYMWADSLIVGMHLGSHELGLYRTGNQFAMMLFALVFGPVVPVLYSYLSRVCHDHKRMKVITEGIIRVIILISVPLGLVVYVASDWISAIVFGSNWTGVGQVLGMMALVQAGSWIIGMNGEVYRAMGKPHLETFVMLLSMIIYLTVYMYAIRQGLEAFVWARFCLMIFGLVAQLWVLKFVLQSSLLPIVLWIGCTAVASWMVVSLGRVIITSWALPQLVQIVLVGLVAVGQIFLVSWVIRTQLAKLDQRVL